MKVVDGVALLPRTPGTTQAAEHEINLAVLQQHVILSGVGDPDIDMRLDLVELFESAIDIERIDLVLRDPRRQQCRLQKRLGLGIGGPAALELLDIPEIRPVLRRVAGEGLGVPGQDPAEGDRGHAILVQCIGDQLVLRHDLVNEVVVDRRELAVLGRQIHHLPFGIDDVPFDVAALLHELQLRRIGRPGGHHLDARRLGEGPNIPFVWASV